MFDVASVGDNTIDSYSDSHMYVGGNALNVAVHLATAGARSMYAGAVGTDRLGVLTTDALARAGVSTEHVLQLPGRTSYSAIALHHDGDREFVEEFFGVSDDYFPDSRTIDELARRDWVHIGMLRDATELRRDLAERGCRVSQDCAVSTGFDNLEIAFCSRDSPADEDALALAKTAITGGAKLAVVTRGAFGSVAFDGTNLWRQEAIPVKVVDTTGAGDTFIAAFLASYVNGRPITDCIQSASVASARTCTHRGGWRQDPLSK
ncbi:PfkB family carbohydrate kinase [Spelaeicoccus albus]|uniref:Fructoselysine 6-kinase n=1 Tax=Spelaeicoccus albus TaxID=1280376 RepID=A0A7Z0D252_9MICO|nr:PfkB family carbohydrate kinase [Spelaeicoccus albus]NYI67482.1 fructoselysine 6-kinase [Spelaeicoccus albus]